MQECDILLHEAGAPPIHTPLKVLSELPEDVKKRLYVVHTSALPEGSDLRVAPTGTAGTIRLDEFQKNEETSAGSNSGTNGELDGQQVEEEKINQSGDEMPLDMVPEAQPVVQTIPQSGNAPPKNNHERQLYSGLGSASNIWERDGQKRKEKFEPGKQPPLVFLRPTCVSDAWFILNLLSNVPFLSR